MRTRKTRVLENSREESSVVFTDTRIEMFVREKMHLAHLDRWFDFFDENDGVCRVHVRACIESFMRIVWEESACVSSFSCHFDGVKNGRRIVRSRFGHVI